MKMFKMKAEVQMQQMAEVQKQQAQQQELQMQQQAQQQELQMQQQAMAPPATASPPPQAPPQAPSHGSSFGNKLPTLELPQSRLLIATGYQTKKPKPIARQVWNTS